MTVGVLLIGVAITLLLVGGSIIKNKYSDDEAISVLGKIAALFRTKNN